MITGGCKKITFKNISLIVGFTYRGLTVYQCYPILHCIKLHAIEYNQFKRENFDNFVRFLDTK